MRFIAYLFNPITSGWHSLIERNFFTKSFATAAVLMGEGSNSQGKASDPVGGFKPFIARNRFPDPVIIASLRFICDRKILNTHV